MSDFEALHEALVEVLRPARDALAGALDAPYAPALALAAVLGAFFALLHAAGGGTAEAQDLDESAGGGGEKKDR